MFNILIYNVCMHTYWKCHTICTVYIIQGHIFKSLLSYLSSGDVVVAYGDQGAVIQQGDQHKHYHLYDVVYSVMYKIIY